MVLTYSVGHVIITSAVHMAIRPVEEVRLRNGRLSPVPQSIKLALGLAQEGVIEVGASLLWGQHFILYYNL